MKKFLNRLFSGIFGRKENKMLTDNDFNNLKIALEVMQKRIDIESKNVNNDNLILQYKSFSASIEATKMSLEIVRNGQNDLSNKGFQDFEEYNKG